MGATGQAAGRTRGWRLAISFGVAVATREAGRVDAGSAAEGVDFADDLQAFATSKGTIRFTPDAADPDHIAHAAQIYVGNAHRYAASLKRLD